MIPLLQSAHPPSVSVEGGYFFLLCLAIVEAKFGMLLLLTLAVFLLKNL